MSAIDSVYYHHPHRILLHSPFFIRKLYSCAISMQFHLSFGSVSHLFRIAAKNMCFSVKRERENITRQKERDTNKA